MNHYLGIAIESLVAVLLILTIVYCMLLNGRLKRLKADEQSLKATIGELITVTEIAERAIGGLKHTVRDVNEHLGSQIALATALADQLKGQLSESDNVLRRLSRIASAARPLVEVQPEAQVEVQPPLQAPKVSAARANAAAAQAFAERRRPDGIAA
ncbi:DUF6468 domain-containing protein [Tardiphaga sp.]|uniref:DUF6468 domain-containing protein n=1 Tax=Tardiphaga sp. TaxID=1926292 RepID=UPI0026281191|nr:DUF6468 domain-containing protein [Tardiphaga sp.]MDB5615829.1 chemotaxis protein [Tardiphaga sp.]